jgi:sigma-E factor negative regulatory protein RseA
MKMAVEHEVGTVALERLSALVDGELDHDAAARACVHWRESGGSRASWHAYQLIGDVLRSDDLASDPAHDARFLAALRARLADEPVVLALQPLESATHAVVEAEHRAGSGLAARSRRWKWVGPSAVAAGFVLVAGALMVARAPDTLPGLQPGVPLADAGSTRAGSTRAVSANDGAGAATTPDVTTTSGNTQTFAPSGALIRDPRLDRYLAAHQQFAGTSALGVPSAFLRSATVSGPDR